MEELWMRLREAVNDLPEWTIFTLLTYHNDEVWLQKGWKEFAECFSLKQGHLLVFRFEDNSHFHMFIFDESTTETDYPSNRPNSNEQGKVDEECESESSVQILSDSP